MLAVVKTGASWAYEHDKGWHRPDVRLRRKSRSESSSPNNDVMKFDFPNLIGELNEQERIRFYEDLAHNLTVSVRGIWSDNKLTDRERVERMRWINEIMHRVVMKSAYLRTKRNKYSETDSWEDIKHWVAQSPDLGTSVEWAIERSYESCRR